MNMNERDERACIVRLKAGQAEAFGVLVDAYEREAAAHAMALLRQHEDAQDAVQEAFLDAFRAMPNFDVRCRFYPWFYVILRARCLKRIERGRHTHMQSFPRQTLLERLPDEQREVADTLEEALASLSCEKREVLLLKYVDGLTYGQLAERLSIPLGTVMSRLFQARRALKESLQRRGVLKTMPKEGSR